MTSGPTDPAPDASAPRAPETLADEGATPAETEQAAALVKDAQAPPTKPSAQAVDAQAAAVDAQAAAVEAQAVEAQAVEAQAPAVEALALSGDAEAPANESEAQTVEAQAPVVGLTTGPPDALAPESSGDAGAEERRTFGPLGYALAAAGGIVVAIAGLALTGSLALGGPAPSPSPSASPSPTPGAFVDGRYLGDAGAPVTIEIWADYQCPFCGLQARGIEPSIERLYAAEGRARIQYRDFAFLGQESFDAAVAARCAGQQNAFWYYHDLLFSSQQGENQGAFAKERLLGLAEFAALDVPVFTTCLADPAVLKAVQDETAEGGQLGVTSTPVLRIDGPGGLQVLTGLKPLSEVATAIERAERPQPSASPSGSAGSPGASDASPGASDASPGPGSEASPSPSATSSQSASPSP